MRFDKLTAILDEVLAVGVGWFSDCRCDREHTDPRFIHGRLNKTREIGDTTIGLDGIGFDVRQYLGRNAMMALLGMNGPSRSAHSESIGLCRSAGRNGREQIDCANGW